MNPVILLRDIVLKNSFLANAHGNGFSMDPRDVSNTNF